MSITEFSSEDDASISLLFLLLLGAVCCSEKKCVRYFRKFKKKFWEKKNYRGCVNKVDIVTRQLDADCYCCCCWEGGIYSFRNEIKCWITKFVVFESSFFQVFLVLNWINPDYEMLIKVEKVFFCFLRIIRDEKKSLH